MSTFLFYTLPLFISLSLLLFGGVSFFLGRRITFLYHSEKILSIMYYSITVGTTKRTMNDYDKFANKHKNAKLELLGLLLLFVLTSFMSTILLSSILIMTTKHYIVSIFLFLAPIFLTSILLGIQTQKNKLKNLI